MKIINSHFIILLLSVIIGNNLFAQCEELEDRINVLEEKIAQLERKLNISTAPPAPEARTTPAVQEEERYPAVKKEPVDETGPLAGKRVTSQVESISNILKSRVLEKEVKSTGGGRGVSLLIAYTNIGRKDIVSFKGTIALEDESGDLLSSYFIDIYLSIPSLESKSAISEVPLSATYSESYRKLFIMKAEEIKTSLNLTEIAFSDGTVRTK